MPTRTADFNLLLPLRALLEERSVSRAAERMHMSQPSLSAALARLRRHFNDELLRRHGNSYELTPLGVQLLERSQSAARGMDRVFSAQAEFDPSTSTRDFSIFSSDYVTSLIGGALAGLVGEVAPRVRLRFNNVRPDVIDNFRDAVRDHDGALLPHGYLVDQSHLDLFRDRWVCMVSTDNSVVGDRLTTEHLSELVWVSTFGGRSEYTPAARQMELLGIEPKSQIVTSNFLVVPALIAGSDRIALIQELLARQLLSHGGVRIVEAPFQTVPLVEAFWWNSSLDHDPEHVWLRSMLTMAAERSGLPSPL